MKPELSRCARVQVADVSDVQSVVSARLWRIAASRHAVTVSTASCHCQCQPRRDVIAASQSTVTDTSPVTSHSTSTARHSPVCRRCDFCVIVCNVVTLRTLAQS